MGTLRAPNHACGQPGPKLLWDLSSESPAALCRPPKGRGRRGDGGDAPMGTPRSPSAAPGGRAPPLSRTWRGSAVLLPQDFFLRASPPGGRSVHPCHRPPRARFYPLPPAGRPPTPLPCPGAPPLRCTPASHHESGTADARAAPHPLCLPHLPAGPAQASGPAAATPCPRLPVSFSGLSWDRSLGLGWPLPHRKPSGLVCGTGRVVLDRQQWHLGAPQTGGPPGPPSLGLHVTQPWESRVHAAVGEATCSGTQRCTGCVPLLSPTRPPSADVFSPRKPGFCLRLQPGLWPAGVSKRVPHPLPGLGTKCSLARGGPRGAADHRPHCQGAAQPLLPDCSQAAPCSCPGMGRGHPHGRAVGLGHQGHPGVREGTGVVDPETEFMSALRGGWAAGQRPLHASQGRV